MKSVLFVPVLKAKKGEIDALGMLPDLSKSSIRPLLDIPRSDSLGASRLAEYLCSKLTSIAAAWGTTHEIMIDLSGYSPTERVRAGIHPIEHVFQVAKQLKLNAMPVTGSPRLHGPEPDYLNAVSAILNRDQRGVGLRLILEEFKHPARLEIIAAETLDVLGCQASDCHLLLDLEAVDRHAELGNEKSLTDILIKAVEAARNTGFKSITVCGSSIPEVVGKQYNKAPCVVDRVEFAVWRKMQESGNAQGIIFGDYGVIYPLTKDSGPSGKPPARIRLSTLGFHHLFRAPREAYRQLSRVVVGESAFIEQAESWGKKCISGRGVGFTGMGGPAEWVARDTNCHIESTLMFIRRILGINLEPSANKSEGNGVEEMGSDPIYWSPWSTRAAWPKFDNICPASHQFYCGL